MAPVTACAKGGKAEDMGETQQATSPLDRLSSHLVSHYSRMYVGGGGRITLDQAAATGVSSPASKAAFFLRSLSFFPTLFTGPSNAALALLSVPPTVSLLGILIAVNSLGVGTKEATDSKFVLPSTSLHLTLLPPFLASISCSFSKSISSPHFLDRSPSLNSFKRFLLLPFFSSSERYGASFRRDM